MRVLKHLFENNQAWVEKMATDYPELLPELAQGQNPDYLWIGCSDSRLLPNEITGLMPGDLFVHRNVGNQVMHIDLNCLSVLEYAVSVLEVEHVIVCGHYSCGAVQAAMGTPGLGLIDNWLQPLRNVYAKHQSFLAGLRDEQARVNKMCELNVLEQVRHVCQTTTVQRAWRKGMSLAVHGWIYNLHDGRLHDLNCCVVGADEVGAIYGDALEQLTETESG